MPLRSVTTPLSVMLFVVALAPSLWAAEPNYQTDVRPVLLARCAECHGADEKSGNVDFTAIADDRLAGHKRRLWRKAVARIEAGEMPPAGAEQLTAAERERLLAWMKRAIDLVDCHDPANVDPGPALLRRLTLAEYNRTVRDLMGFEFDAGATVGMTDEVGEGNSYGNLATALDMPPALLEKYFAAADQILNRLFAVELSSSVDGRIQEQARNSREQMFSLKPGEWRQAEFIVTPPAGIEPRDAARSLIASFTRRAYRGQASANDIERLLAIFDRAVALEKSYGESIRAMLKAVLVSPKFLYRIEQNSADAESVAVRVSNHELAVRLSYFLWSSMPDDELFDLAERSRLTAEGPSAEPIKLLGQAISAVAPEQHQGNNRDNVFDGELHTFLDGPDANSYWIGIDLGAAKPIERVRYAGRIGLEQRMIGGKFQAASSADFATDFVELFEIKEPPPRGWVTRDLEGPVARRYVRYLPPANSFGNIAEFEVRGRAAGTVLEQQVRRMLADPRARALTDNFALRWLQVHKLPTARPSTEFFPEFNASIRVAMFDETAMFCDSLRREDRSVLELLDADYTFVNEELAKYYGLAHVQGKELRRVALKPADHRGGLLGMGSMLALTSHTSRTSPTLRGKWILEVMFGTPPPPPPANVAQIKDEQDKKQEAQTFREQLAQHARDTACAACHRKMDPLGFALDNFDAVGRWREKLGDRPLDVTGQLPTGEKLNGADDVKRIVLARKDQFVRNLSEQLLMYALGRELADADDCPIQQITTKLKREDYRFSTLVMEIVKSYPFQFRRCAQLAEPRVK